jgi:hypothetical protein
MSQALHNLIQIAVRSAANKPHREQTRILQDCYDCADSPQLKRELQRLGGLCDTAETELIRFEAQPDEDRI